MTPPTRFPRCALHCRLSRLRVASNNKPHPQDYSPGYSYVATAPGGSRKERRRFGACAGCLLGRAGGRRSICPLRADLTIVSGVGTHLPPGCANAYNLQRMVESERDLIEGRRIGPAAGAPTVRAARRYLYGDELLIGGANAGTTEPPLPPNN